MYERSAAGNAGRPRGSSLLFAAPIAALVLASIFAGAALRPTWDRLRSPTPGDAAVALEHAGLDVRLGRGAAVVERLGKLARTVTEPALRERALALWAEAALQAGQLRDAATAEEQREPLAPEEARPTIRLRRVALAVALDDRGRAKELARPLLERADPRIADQVRVELAAGLGERELRAWIAAPHEGEEARAAGVAALRLLGDAEAAARLLAPLANGGAADSGLYEALADAYARLERHRDVARMCAALAALASTDAERVRLLVVRSKALARAGEGDEALAVLEPLARSDEAEVSRAARRARYEVLQATGRLARELTAVRDPGERAFVALEVERNYTEAARLYEAARRLHPGSIEIADGLREALRRRELAERRDLYVQVLDRDPQDRSAREKLLATLVGLGDGAAVQRWVDEALRGRQSSSEALVAVASALARAGLAREAVPLLERAYASERDPSRKQQILFPLGEAYLASRQEDSARRLFTALASEGASPEVRDHAMARLAPLLR
jgi:hypothetical protein